MIFSAELGPKKKRVGGPNSLFKLKATGVKPNKRDEKGGKKRNALARRLVKRA